MAGVGVGGGGCSKGMHILYSSLILFYALRSPTSGLEFLCEKNPTTVLRGWPHDLDMGKSSVQLLVI